MPYRLNQSRGSARVKTPNNIDGQHSSTATRWTREAIVLPIWEWSVRAMLQAVLLSVTPAQHNLQVFTAWRATDNSQRHMTARRTKLHRRQTTLRSNKNPSTTQLAKTPMNKVCLRLRLKKKLNLHVFASVTSHVPCNRAKKSSSPTCSSI